MIYSDNTIFNISIKLWPVILQVDLGKVTTLVRIATQGIVTSWGLGFWVKAYKIAYSTDGGTWNFYMERGTSNAKVSLYGDFFLNITPMLPVDLSIYSAQP